MNAAALTKMDYFSLRTIHTCTLHMPVVEPHTNTHTQTLERTSTIAKLTNFDLNTVFVHAWAMETHIRIRMLTLEHNLIEFDRVKQTTPKG